MSLLGGGSVPVLAQGAAPASGRVNPFADLGLPEIEITITATAFEGVPADLTAGRYVLTVTNALKDGAERLGSEASGINFLRLTDDLTAEAFIAAMAAYGVPPETADVAASLAAADSGSIGLPAWFYEVVIPGGPYALPGETASAVIDLSSGE